MASAIHKIHSRSSELIKVLVADTDYQIARRLAEYLSDRGFDARAINDGHKAKDEIYRWKPRFVIADLMLPNQNAFSLLNYIHNDAGLKQSEIHLLVISGHNTESNVREAFRRGAKDYLIRPIGFDDILSRLILHCRHNKHIAEANESVVNDHSQNPGVVLQLFDLMLSQAMSEKDMNSVLYNMTRMTGLKQRAARCSIVRCVTQSYGIVMASNDNKKISGFKLNLNKYPEIQVVVNSKETLAIENIESNSQLKLIKPQLKSFDFNSIIVSPILYKKQIFGVLSVRMPSEFQTLTDNQIRFNDIAAKTISLYLSRFRAEDLAKFGPTIAS